MLETQLLTDLAIVLIVASLVSLLFHRLKQPIVVGYIIAGLIVGPYTPPFSLISQPEILSSLAELGVILLLFGIGLNFPLRKLREVGRAALLISSIEIALMFLLSLLVGNVMGWSLTDSVFLGAALASSSTAIIAKVLSDMGKLNETSSIIMLGVLVVEDLAVVLLLAAIQSAVSIGTISVEAILTLGVKIVLFLGGSLFIGWKAVTPFMARVLREESDELTITTTVGLCFAFSIAAYLLGFSVAIGAFIAGVVFANLREHEKVLSLTASLRDMFGAIFFVSVGALMDVTKFESYLLPTLMITLTMLGGKFAGCSLGTRIAGYDRYISVRVGMGMAQIGEFAFIVMKVGSDLGVTSPTLFATVGVVAIITTFLTPYLIRASYHLGVKRQSLGTPGNH